MTDHLGKQFGNYRLIRLLGEGGFAEVYLGEHVHLGTQAAVKVLHTKLIEVDLDAFRNEARTIARLEHPHIVRVFDFGVAENTPYLVMSYAINGTLRQRHPKGSILPLAKVVTYVKQLADALQYAHDEKLIHRDVKPENMLVGKRQEILLSDFGIAVTVQSSRYQNAENMAGTITYMAPEQIQGKPRPASDQYSLGVVIYGWLTGTRPFHGSLTEIVAQHLSATPPSIREKLPTISPSVEEVVMKTLTKDPKGRFARINDLASALEQVTQLTNSQSSVVLDVLTTSNPSQPKIIAIPNDRLSIASKEVVLTHPLEHSTRSSILNQNDNTKNKGLSHVLAFFTSVRLVNSKEQAHSKSFTSKRPIHQSWSGLRFRFIITLVAVVMIVLLLIGSLFFVQGQRNNSSTATTPTPGVTSTTKLTATVTPDITPTSVPFQVTSVNLTVNPLSIAGKSCGTQLTVTYTATFNVLSKGPGGAILFAYTTDGGRTVLTGVVQLNPGETSKKFQFPYSGTLELNGAFPGAGQLTTTHPGSVSSQAVTPSGACTPVTPTPTP